MKYRRFGRLDWEVSALGLGAPLSYEVLGPEGEKNTPFFETLRHYIDHGVNYLDLGYPFNWEWQERLLDQASRTLRDGYRERVRVALDLPVHRIEAASDLDRYLEKQLRRLQAERVDLCFLTWLNRESWSKLLELDVLGWAERALRRGSFAGLGFAFHDDFQVLREIIGAYGGWSACKFQYSYVDADHHPGLAGLRLAVQNGLAVVAVEPLRRRRLVTNLPRPVAEIWEAASAHRSVGEWGMRWVWNHPEVSVVVGEWRTPKEASENLTLADDAQPNSLTVREQLLFSRAREAYRRLRPVPCTSCRCCMPCAEGIDVPRILELYNEAVVLGCDDLSRTVYRLEGHGSARCTACGSCLRGCPRRIAILDWLVVADRVLS